MLIASVQKASPGLGQEYFFGGERAVGGVTVSHSVIEGEKCL